MTTNWKWKYTTTCARSTWQLTYIYQTNHAHSSWWVNTNRQDDDTFDISHHSSSIFQNTSYDRTNDLLNFYHANHSVISYSNPVRDIVFLPEESLQGSCNSFTVFKCRFKFDNLHLFAILAMPAPQLCCGKQSHAVSRMTLSKVCQDWTLK